MSDFARYSRQVVLPEIGVNGQAILRDSAALIVGLGGLGSIVSLYLAGAGIGRLTLIDADTVDAGNLQRQLLFSSDDLGRPKAQAAQARLAALNPEVAVEAVIARADAGNLQVVVANVDIVFDCSDNFPTRFAINRACVAARRPLVSAAAIRFSGLAALFEPARGGGCYACLFDEIGEDGERCEDAGVLGPVVGAVASLQTLIGLRRLLGIGRDAGRLHRWNATTLTWRDGELPADPFCPICGTAGGAPLP